MTGIKSCTGNFSGPGCVVIGWQELFWAWVQQMLGAVPHSEWLPDTDAAVAGLRGGGAWRRAKLSNGKGEMESFHTYTNLYILIVKSAKFAKSGEWSSEWNKTDASTNLKNTTGLKKKLKS